MLPFLSNVFYDTSSPWYYVIGVLFLLLIFGAVAVYVIWNGKRNKNSADQAEPQNEEKTTGADDNSDAGETETATDAVETSSEHQPPSDK